ILSCTTRAFAGGIWVATVSTFFEMVSSSICKNQRRRNQYGSTTKRRSDSPTRRSRSLILTTGSQQPAPAPPGQARHPLSHRHPDPATHGPALYLYAHAIVCALGSGRQSSLSWRVHPTIIRMDLDRRRLRGSALAACPLQQPVRDHHRQPERYHFRCDC